MAGQKQWISMASILLSPGVWKMSDKTAVGCRRIGLTGESLPLLTLTVLGKRPRPRPVEGTCGVFDDLEKISSLPLATHTIHYKFQEIDNYKSDSFDDRR